MGKYNQEVKINSYKKGKHWSQFNVDYNLAIQNNTILRRFPTLNSISDAGKIMLMVGTKDISPAVGNQRRL